MNTSLTPANTVERDLCNLVGERVQKAVMSVVQLADDPTQAFMVASTAEATVAGILAAAYCRMTDTPIESADPTAIAIAVLQCAKEAAGGES